MPTFTEQRMGRSSMMDRTLDQGFSKVPRLSRLNCKILLFWSTYLHPRLFSISGLTMFGPKPWDSMDLRWLTVMGLMSVRWFSLIMINLLINPFKKFDGNIISRNWLQANPGVQVPGWSLSSLQAHWWVFLLIKTSIIVVGVVGEGHGTGPSHPVAQKVLREMILGEAF